MAPSLRSAPIAGDAVVAPRKLREASGLLGTLEAFVSMCAAPSPTRCGGWGRERYVRVFEACDEDKKGYLSREDFKVAVVMLFGYKPSKVEVDSVMASVQQNNSGVLLEEFLKLMSAKKAAQLYHSEKRQIFTAFDMQYKGFLTLEDFKRAFNSVAPKLPERMIVEAFSQTSCEWRAVHTTQDILPHPRLLQAHTSNKRIPVTARGSATSPVQDHRLLGGGGPAATAGKLVGSAGPLPVQ
ncbi:EF-hand calcium-binding domain-containing protein 11 isoform X2 [Pelodiscus sinensis]|uniref:EF-hand calcium-binding domain-containing protein 11 isoform X2 n=1 Tax=Pelodiscus sinensis TaxID=13735 RepID=UPI003F6BE075